MTTTSGPARELHDRALPADPIPEIWIHEVDEPTLVLGSTQGVEMLDLARATADGVAVCSRRSGGGVVALEPGRSCWIDVVLPRSSSRWNDDVGHAFHWLGAVWAEALGQANPALRSRDISMHRGQLEGGPAGRLICFASLGPGEITVRGRKVIGLSQRRTANAARFQTAVQGPWDRGLLPLYLKPGAVAAAGVDWDRLDFGLHPQDWPGTTVLAESFIDCLPEE